MLSTLSRRSQFTLPKDIRQFLQLGHGDTIAFIPALDGTVTLTKASKPSFAKLRGILPQPNQAHSVEEMNQAVLEVAAIRGQ